MPRTTTSALHSHAVGRELKRRRGEAGLTQAQVADRLDVSQSYVQSVEAGRVNLTVGQLGRFADALHATLSITLAPAQSDPTLARLLADTRA